MRGVLAPSGAGTVVEPRRVAARVPRRVLHGDERHAAVQEQRDERVAPLVRVQAGCARVRIAGQSGVIREIAEEATDRLAVVGHTWRRGAGAEAAAVLAAKQRCLRARADPGDNRALGALVEGTSTSLPPLPRTARE